MNSNLTELRIRLEGLDTDDARQISACLDASAVAGLVRWQLSNAPDAELVLRSDNQFAPLITGLDAPIEAVLADADLPTRLNPARVLRRPVQTERFHALLRSAEAEWMLRHAPIPAAPPLRPAQPPTAEGPERGPARSEPGLRPGARIRLRRWPGNALLAEHRGAKVLASFLANHYLRLDQLVAASGLPRSVCVEFVLRLSAEGLLDVRAPAAPSEPAAAPVGGAPARSDFIDRLRGRLGRT